MITRTNLIKKIKTEFPKIRHHADYADLILKGVKLQALDSGSARRSKEFLNNPKITKYVFTKCHKDLDLLVKIDAADYSVSPMSERDKVVFKFSKAQLILDQEKSLLLDHISNSDKVKKITTDKLKLPAAATISNIKRIMDRGNIFKQGSTYEKIFNALKDKKIRPTGYLWFGIRPMPIPKYHLSKKAINLIKDIS